MCQFIESIRIASGRISEIELHQQRVNNTLANHNLDIEVNLMEGISRIAFPTDLLLKCRIIYGKLGIVSVEFIPYEIRPIKTLKIVRNDFISYTYKYYDRAVFKKIMKCTKTDEVIIVKSGFVTDATYANLAFYDGCDWLTPETPLLGGIRRTQLLQKSIIKEAKIKETDIWKFTSIKLINAMMTWEESIELPITAIIHA